MNRTHVPILLVTIILTGAALQPVAGDLVGAGRLFTTPAQRSAIDAALRGDASQSGTAASPDLPSQVPEPGFVRGIVGRGERIIAVWPVDGNHQPGAAGDRGQLGRIGQLSRIRRERGH